MTLTQFASICRQYGVNFRVLFSHNHSYVVIKGSPAALQGSPVHLAITGRYPHVRVAATTGAEGIGFYFELESLS